MECARCLQFKSCTHLGTTLTSYLIFEKKRFIVHYQKIYSYKPYDVHLEEFLRTLHKIFQYDGKNRARHFDNSKTHHISLIIYVSMSSIFIWQLFLYDDMVIVKSMNASEPSSGKKVTNYIEFCCQSLSTFSRNTYCQNALPCPVRL